MNPQQLKLFGFKVQSLRKELKLERDAIAAQLDVHPRTYAKWENGQSEPPLGKALEIAQLLHSTLNELLGESTPQVSSTFSNNTQEGENCVMHNNIVTFDRETMQAINSRFAFLEDMIRSERNEKKAVLDEIAHLKNR